MEMEKEMEIYPKNARGPYIKDVILNENDTLLFDGYFHYDQKDLPQQKVLVIFGDEATDNEGNSCRSASSVQHIEIYEKYCDEDTQGHIHTHIYPTEFITLKYRVIKSDLTAIERQMILETIIEQEKTHEKAKLTALIASAIKAEEQD